MANVNRLVDDASPSNRYATFFCAQFDPSCRRMTYVNGGHNPPMVLRGAETARLEAGRPPVGLFRLAQYELAEVQLDPGDLLVLFTDVSAKRSTPPTTNGAKRRWKRQRALAAALRRRKRSSESCVTRTNSRQACLHDDMKLVVARMV